MIDDNSDDEKEFHPVVLLKYGQLEHLQDLLHNGNIYVNSIEDLPISITGYLTYNKNPITEKILRTSGLDEYNNYMKKNRSQLDIRDYARLLNFYPFI